MLHSDNIINSVLKSLNKIKVKKIILDPVMVAKGGTKLINNKSIEVLLASIFTPLHPLLCNKHVLLYLIGWKAPISK